MSAADFAAMTGADEQAAAMYLEMAGGNMEIAVSIFFDGGAFPAAWLDQGLEAEFERGQLVVRQHGNGPCGVLAAAHALAATYGLADGASALRRAAAAMVAVCGIDGDAKVARWAGDVGGAVTHDVVAADVGAVEARVGAAFEARGGVALLVYSCVLSRGAARCLADAAVDGGGGPLIYGPFHLCTTELLNLLLFGVARGDVGAYGGGDAAKADWRGASPVGLLSADEVESGVPVADELKSPAGRAWIVHGGSHFTTLWFAAADGGAVDLWHWNGLPPNRALRRLRLAPASLEPAPKTPGTWRPTRYRLVVGEIESVVQAHPADKAAAPRAWRTHRYELALATAAHVADDAQSPARPADAPPPPLFELGDADPDEKWRCAACYKDRFRTFCFGENAAGSDACKFCGAARAGNHTIWRRFDDLPPAARRRVDRASGPKLLSILRTRWPDAELLVEEDAGFVPAGDARDPLPAV